MTWRAQLKALSGTDKVAPLLLFTALWAVAFFSARALEYGPGVSAWFLPAGLKIAFLLRYGPRFVIPIAIVGLAFGILLWLPHWPVAWVLTDLVPTITYFGGAVYLASANLPDRPLQTVHQVASFLIVAPSIAAMSGLATVGIMVWQGITPGPKYLEMAAAFLLGDLVGVLTIGPVVVLGLSEFDRKPAHPKGIQHQGLARADILAFLFFGIAATIVAGLGYLSPDLSRLPYLFFLPILYTAVSASALTATMIVALVNVAVVLFLKFSPSGISPLHSQAIMIALASCGLILMAYRQEHLRLLSMAQASQAALHDLKSPLFSLRLLTEGKSGKSEVSDRDLTGPVSYIESMAKAIFENTVFGHSVRLPSPDRVSIQGLFDTLFMQLSPLAEFHGLALVFRPTNLVVMTDQGRLTRVTQNLIVNAIEHGREGRRVLIGGRPYREGIRICVYDTGPGTLAHHVRRFFEPGYSTSGKSDRGFGLTFSKVIAEQLGMRIGVRSVEGRGSCFWIEIPSRLIALRQTSELKTSRA